MLADSDTRWKWGALTARRLAPEARIDGLLLRGRATPTPRQLAEVGVRADSLREVTGAEFVRTAGDKAYDVVVLACVGGAVQAMLHGLSYAGGHRPVVVTGYVGVVYEKLADGLLLRHGADLVLANSPYDARRFRTVYEGAGADSGAVTECALPFLEESVPEPDEADGAFTVVFAAQPSVPANRADRAYLLRRAVEHARTHPEREVLIKLRSKPGEHTTHIEEQPYQKLVRRLPTALPPNCRLAYGHMGTVLDEARRTGGMLVTVSSTAALESLHRSVPTAVLTDLGVRETLGNHYFLGSGCLTSWNELDAGHLPEPDGAWTEQQGLRAPADFASARARVSALLARGRSEALPPLTPYYTQRTAPGYLPGILRRYGFAADGSPLSEPTATSRGMVRRAVREVARGAYRHGVQRVAPVIRRAGEL